jgi:hypothetical protein
VKLFVKVKGFLPKILDKGTNVQYIYVQIVSFKPEEVLLWKIKWFTAKCLRANSAAVAVSLFTMIYILSAPIAIESIAHPATAR